jgi:hypothetical protein
MSIHREEEGAYGEEGRTPEEQDRAAEGGVVPPRKPEEPRVPSSVQAQDELVDRASEESFPASDPPAYWQRLATLAEDEERSESPASEGPSDISSGREDSSEPEEPEHG